MNRRLSPALLVACAALFAAAPSLARADDPPANQTESAQTLKVGDKAPALDVSKWVKGSPITGFEKGKVYVVEFWATWCGPCVASMPHLSALQREYKSKGITIVGVSSKDPNNSLEQVEKMVESKGDGMDYTVAYDESRTVSDAYMKAAQQRGIPTAFVVNAEGNIAYIGHPMWLDIPLEALAKGEWDIVKGNAKLDEAQKELRSIFKMSQKDTKGAIDAFGEFEKKYPAVGETFLDTKYGWLLKAGDKPGAAKLAGALVDKAIKNKDSGRLNQISWGIVDPEGEMDPKDRDLDLAFRAASEAVRITDNKDGMILDTLARVYFLKGDRTKAIEIQRKAIELAPERMKEDLQKTLAEYEKN